VISQLKATEQCHCERTSLNLTEKDFQHAFSSSKLSMMFSVLYLNGNFFELEN